MAPGWKCRQHDKTLITCDPIQEDTNACVIFGPGPRPPSGPLGPGNLYRFSPRLLRIDYHLYPAQRLGINGSVLWLPQLPIRRVAAHYLSPYLCPIANSLTAHPTIAERTQFFRLTRQLIRFFQPASIITSYLCTAFCTAWNCTTRPYSHQSECTNIVIFQFCNVYCHFPPNHSCDFPEILLFQILIFNSLYQVKEQHCKTNTYFRVDL
jgi:hypothetical protein